MSTNYIISILNAPNIFSAFLISSVATGRDCLLALIVCFALPDRMKPFQLSVPSNMKVISAFNRWLSWSHANHMCTYTSPSQLPSVGRLNPRPGVSTCLALSASPVRVTAYVKCHSLALFVLARPPAVAVSAFEGLLDNRAVSAAY